MSSVAMGPWTVASTPAATRPAATARTCRPTPPVLVARTRCTWRPRRPFLSATTYRLHHRACIARTRDAKDHGERRRRDDGGGDPDCHIWDKGWPVHAS